MIRKFFKKQDVSIVLVTIAAFLLVTGVLMAATTIGTNITTGGTLDVTGVSTFSRASSTSATSSLYLMVSNGGSVDNLDYTGGDLYISNDAEIDGTLYFDRATGTSATTTAYVYIGSDITEPSGWDFSGDLIVSDDVFFNSQATTSVSLWVGSGGTTNKIDLSGGDLYVQNDAEIDGSTYMVNASTTGTFVSGGRLTVSTTTATTTVEAYIGAAAGQATTSLTIGHNEGTNGCIELWEAGTSHRLYITATGTLLVETGRCED